VSRITDARSGWQHLFRRWLRGLIARKWFDVGLRGKMSALVTIGLTGLLAIFSFIAISTVRQATQQQLSEHVLRARILAESMDSNIGQIAGILNILAPELDMSRPAIDIRDWGMDLHDDFRSVQGVYLFDPEANLLASTAGALAINWQEVPALHGNTSQVARRISIEGIPRPYAILVVPVISAGSQVPNGSLAALLDLSNPNIFLAGSSLGVENDGMLQILDGKGTVLASSNPGRTLTPAAIDKITSQLFIEGKPMVEACLGCQGDEFSETGTVIAFAPLKQAPWGILIWHDSAHLFAPVRKLGLQTLVLGVVAFLGAFILVMLTTRSVITPVQILTDATRKISEVQFDTPTLKSVQSDLSSSLGGKHARRDEIGVLSNSFIAMCNRLQLSIEETQALNRELDARVQARTQQLSTLNAMTMTVNQSLNLKEILDLAIDEVLQLTGIDMTAIFLQEPSQGRLKLMAHRGLSESAARLAYQVGLLDSDCGGVLELGRVVVVPDLSQHRGRGAESLKREAVTALMHVPLQTKGRSVGSMCLGTRNHTEFDPEEQKLFTAIGNQIAIAVENARLYAELQHKERIRGELFQKALAAQEEERKRIARELHDEISQSLTALLYEAEAGLELSHGVAVKKRLQSIYDLTQHSLDNIHNLIFDLRPSMLDQLGLVPAVRWMAKNRLEPRGMRVIVEIASVTGALESELGLQRLSPEIETALFRVIQEAINNIARHSAARNVDIQLELDGESASINIEDDGIGFNPAEMSAASAEMAGGEAPKISESGRGLGLAGMQERIELLRGELEIDAAPGAGTRIHMRVPLPERSAAYD
jgi:signal transduction histidine kinase